MNDAMEQSKSAILLKTNKDTNDAMEQSKSAILLKTNKDTTTN